MIFKNIVHTQIMTAIVYKYDKNSSNYSIEKYNSIESFLKLDMFKELQNRERNLLIQIDLFDNVNAFIKRNNTIVFKVKDIRSVYLVDKVIFIFSGFYTHILPNIIQFEKTHSIYKYNENYTLSCIEFVLNFIVYEGNAFIENNLKELHAKISRKNLNEINIQEIYLLQNKVNRNIEHYIDIQELLDEITKSDKDVMRLTNMCGDNVEEIELIFNNYVNLMRDIINEYKNINNQIDNFKNLTELQVANFRNHLALITVHINIITLFFAIGSFVVGAFGMNLNNGMEDIKYAMYTVFGILNALILMLITGYFLFYNKFYKSSHILNLDIT